MSQLAAITVLGSPLSACSSGAPHYERAVKETWKHANWLATPAQQRYRELVRYATLAASSHNTQCWKFKLEDQRISILPDLARRCPAVDPDDHHLFASLGCAAENLLHAAQAAGLRGNVSFDAAGGDVVRVDLESGTASASELYQAIPQRQSARVEYDGKPVPTDQLKRLEEVGRADAVNVLLFAGKDQLEKVLEYVVQGNIAQMADAAFVEELKAWIRFNEADAVRTGDGLFARSTGNPTVPRWLGRLMLNFFFTAKNENEKYTKHIRSSAGIAVFVSDKNDKAHWVEAGRACERFALQATALGLRTAFLNQPVEVSSLRPQFAAYLGVGNRRPDLVVRFGYGPETPRSLRRPVEQVIV